MGPRNHPFLATILAICFLAACAGVPGYVPAGSLARGRPCLAAARAGRPLVKGNFRVREGDLPSLEGPMGLGEGWASGLTWMFESPPGGLRVDLDHARWTGRGNLDGANASWEGAPLSGPVDAVLDLARVDLSVADVPGRTPFRKAIGAQLVVTRWDLDPGPARGEEVGLVPWVGSGVWLGDWRSPVGMELDLRLGIPGHFPILDRYLDWLAVGRADVHWTLGKADLSAGYGWEVFVDDGHRGERGRYLQHGARLGVAWAF